MKKNIVIGPSSFNRTVSKATSISLRNRFVENNPILNDTEASYISRPALNKFAEVGDGHIRKVFAAPGVFNNDLFVVSGTFLWRVNKDSGESVSLGELSTLGTGSISMAATAPIAEEVSAYLFIAEGGVLWVYSENGSALGHLEVSTSVANNDTVVIDTTYYKFTTGSVDTGTPDGTAGNPWLVKTVGTNAEDFLALFHAINVSGVEGTEYSTGTVEHPTVEAISVGPGDLYVRAKEVGVFGNIIPVTETGAGLAWESATLTGGGEEQLRQVPMPSDYGAISVAHINSYVIVVPIQDEDIGTNGRFYWVRPGEISVDSLDFATAERSPDKIHQVIVFGEMFWLLGEKTTEPWITTGDISAPMQKFQGLLFDRGSWAGTAVQVKDSLIVVDEDGGVFQIGGGQKRISRPDIEEKIRKAIQREAFSGL